MIFLLDSVNVGGHAGIQLAHVDGQRSRNLQNRRQIWVGLAEFDILQRTGAEIALFRRQLQRPAEFFALIPDYSTKMLRFRHNIISFSNPIIWKLWDDIQEAELHFVNVI